MLLQVEKGRAPQHASNVEMQRTELGLAAAAESLADAGNKWNQLAEQTRLNRGELYNITFGLEAEAAAAMQQHLADREPEGTVTADRSLLHILRDRTHIEADAVRKVAKEFSFDAAFVVSKPGRESIWVGKLKTKLLREDVTTASRKVGELQQYIDDADGDLSQEAAGFWRQAGQLRFLKGRQISLLFLSQGPGRFIVQEPRE